MRVRALALPFLATAALAACSSHPSPSSSSGAPDAAHFAGVMADAFCGALQACCSARSITYDQGSCVAQMQFYFQVKIDAVKRGSVTYDASAVAACEDAWKKREAACSVDAGDGSESPDTNAAIAAACAPVLRGTVAPGSSCGAPEECAAGPNTIATCQPDYRDSSDPRRTVCFIDVQRVPVGGACRARPAVRGFETDECDADQGYCDSSHAPSDDPTVGVCVPYAKVGDDCVGNDPQHTPVCAPTTSVCDYASTRRCVALPAIGQPCVPQGVYACVPNAWCDASNGGSGTCAPLKNDGDACNSSFECASRACTFSIGDGGMPFGTCTFSPNGSGSALFDVAPRTCGFGPEATGPEDAGIVAAQAHALSRSWYRLR